MSRLSGFWDAAKDMAARAASIFKKDAGAAANDASAAGGKTENFDEWVAKNKASSDGAAAASKGGGTPQAPSSGNGGWASKLPLLGGLVGLGAVGGHLQQLFTYRSGISATNVQNRAQFISLNDLLDVNLGKDGQRMSQEDILHALRDNDPLNTVKFETSKLGFGAERVVRDKNGHAVSGGVMDNATRQALNALLGAQIQNDTSDKNRVTAGLQASAAGLDYAAVLAAKENQIIGANGQPRAMTASEAMDRLAGKLIGKDGKPLSAEVIGPDGKRLQGALLDSFNQKATAVIQGETAEQSRISAEAAAGAAPWSAFAQKMDVGLKVAGYAVTALMWALVGGVVLKFAAKTEWGKAHGLDKLDANAENAAGTFLKQIGLDFGGQGGLVGLNDPAPSGKAAAQSGGVYADASAPSAGVKVASAAVPPVAANDPAPVVTKAADARPAAGQRPARSLNADLAAPVSPPPSAQVASVTPSRNAPSSQHALT